MSPQRLHGSVMIYKTRANTQSKTNQVISPLQGSRRDKFTWIHRKLLGIGSLSHELHLVQTAQHRRVHELHVIGNVGLEDC